MRTMQYPKPFTMNTLLKTAFASTLTVFAFAASLPAKVTGSGNVTTETRAVTGFHGLELLTSGNAIITQGDTEGLVIEGEDNILPLIETTVTDKGTLRIGFKSREDVHFTKPLTFKVSVKTLDTVALAGSGNVRAKSLTAEHFAIKVLGSGDVSLEHLETGALTLAIDGSGNVVLAGKAASQTVSINGSGDYEAAGFKTGTATVDVAGSGDCEIAVSETLAATASGSGDISYYGKPVVTKQVSGSGSVDSLGMAK